MKNLPVLLPSFEEYLQKERRLMECDAFVSMCTRILARKPTKSDLREIWIKRYAPIFGRIYRYPTTAHAA